MTIATGTGTTTTVSATMDAAVTRTKICDGEDRAGHGSDRDSNNCNGDDRSGHGRNWDKDDRNERQPQHGQGFATGTPAMRMGICNRGDRDGDRHSPLQFKLPKKMAFLVLRYE